MLNTLENANPITIRRLFWALACVLGLQQAWDLRYLVQNDAISYMDMGEAYLRGEWAAALNGMWNPLFGWLWGIAQRVLGPSAKWEYPTLHLLVFALFVVTMACFDFLLRELILWKERNTSNEEEAIPAAVWTICGYSIFLWASLGDINIAETNPDMLVAAFFFLAAALVLRIRGGRRTWIAYTELGLTLGLGYLTKSVFLILAVPFLFAVAFGLPEPRKRVRGICLAVLPLLVLSAPFIVALSLARGRFTFGETGRFNYAVHVNGITPRHWHGEDPDGGLPVHPTRRIFDHPAAFEFASPLIGTYPLWYDISYWYEGLEVAFDPYLEARAFLQGARVILGLCFGLYGSQVVLAMLWLALAGMTRPSLADLLRLWPLALPALVGLLLYAAVHVESRYVAPYLAVLFLCVFFGVRLPASVITTRLAAASAYILLAMVLLSFGLTAASRYAALITELALPSDRQPDYYEYYEAADAIHNLGVRPGDPVASVSYANIENVKWLRLARIRTIAEVYYRKDDPRTFENNFWNADPITQRKVLNAFFAVGARAVVSDENPRGENSAGWQRIGSTHFFVHLLNH